MKRTLRPLRRAAAALACTSLLWSTIGITRSQAATKSKTETINEAGSVQKLVIKSPAGSISINAGTEPTVTITRTLHWKSKQVVPSRSLKDGTLTLKDNCSGNRIRGCWVDYTVTLPATVMTDIETGAGDVRITAMSEDITIDSGAGDVDLVRSSASKITISSGAGDVKAEFTTPPNDVNIETGAGDVTAVVPKGSYRVDVSSGIGDETIEGVTSDPNAKNSIVLSSGAGDVTLRAAK